MILLWGVPDEPPLARVAEELELLGAPWQLLDQRDEPETIAELTFDHRLHASVSIRDRVLDLDAATAVYHRCQDPRTITERTATASTSAEWDHVLSIEDLLLSWLELTNALVVNRPSDMGSNSSKPYQLASIAAAGFRTPATLVTTDPGTAEAFWARHGEVVYKSVSGVRSIVARLRPEDRDRLADVRFCPTQFQQFIAGIDYRVHVVRERVFATRIESNLDDYRYSGAATPALAACNIDDQLAEQCVAMCARMGLHLAGIDLRLTPEGDWYCFEVNPSPAFTYYENATGQPIAAAIAQLLVSR
ncbi:MAG TPA: ATP-grasp domain-containing protein [Vicinamibacterales bacterium]